MRLGRKRLAGVAAVALSALALAAPAARAVGPTPLPVGTSEPAGAVGSFELYGSNDYYIQVKATRRGHGPATVRVTASHYRYKVESESVQYSAPGRLTPHGLTARLPGIGRIALRFEQRGAEKYPGYMSAYCHGRVPLLRRGIFRGGLAIRGDHGFTSASTEHIGGRIVETFPERCQPPELEPPSHGSPETENVFATGPSLGGTVTFSAAGTTPTPLPPGAAPSLGSGIPDVAFWATYRTQRGRLGILTSASVDTGPGYFTTAPPGAPTDATVTPPGPFEGAAAFHLESPTAASWTGDLAADFPGFGRVPLTGPGIEASLCWETSCSETIAARG